MVNFDLHYKIAEGLSVFGVIGNVFNQRYSTYGILGTMVYSAASEQFRTPAPARAFWLGATYLLERR